MCPLRVSGDSCYNTTRKCFFFKTYIFRFWAYVCIKLRATVACGGDVSENTFAFQSIKVTESNLTPSFLYIPGLCVTWWILCHQVKGNLQVNGSFRVGLMSVICMAIYKCTNNNNISKAYSRLRDMWVNSYENDYNAYEFLTFGAKKKPAKTFLSPLSFASHWYLPKSSSFTLVITNWLCVLLCSWKLHWPLYQYFGSEELLLTLAHGL